MEKSAKFIIIKGVIVMVVVALAGFFLLNGFGKRPYTSAEIEGAFRARAAEQGVVGQGEELFASATYGNSTTFVIQTEDGERACGTYGRSMFYDKYKELQFYAGVNGVLALDEMTYHVSDGVIGYDVTIGFGDDVSITPGDEVQPVMYIKVMIVSLAMMGIFGAKIFLGRRR